MPTTNTIRIEGNLVAEVDMKILENGTSLVKFTIANNRNIKKGDEWIQKTGYYDVTVWADLAENCAELLTKGSKVIVDGRLNYETWESNDGKRHKVSITAEEVSLPVGSVESFVKKAAKSKSSNVESESDPF